MVEHTPEPWAFEGGRPNGEVFMTTRYRGAIRLSEEQEIVNARRIVACVNKLAGWDIHQLEDEFLLARPVNSCDVSIADGGELLT